MRSVTSALLSLLCLVPAAAFGAKSSRISDGVRAETLQTEILTRIDHIRLGDDLASVLRTFPTASSSAVIPEMYEVNWGTGTVFSEQYFRFADGRLTSVTLSAGFAMDGGWEEADRVVRWGGKAIGEMSRRWGKPIQASMLRFRVMERSETNVAWLVWRSSVGFVSATFTPPALIMKAAGTTKNPTAQFTVSITSSVESMSGLELMPDISSAPFDARDLVVDYAQYRQKMEVPELPATARLFPAFLRPIHLGIPMKRLEKRVTEEDFLPRQSYSSYISDHPLFYEAVYSARMDRLLSVSLHPKEKEPSGPREAAGWCRHLLKRGPDGLIIAEETRFERSVFVWREKDASLLLEVGKDHWSVGILHPSLPLEEQFPYLGNRPLRAQREVLRERWRKLTEDPLAPLTADLRSSDPRRRVRAVTAIGQSKDPRASIILEEAYQRETDRGVLLQIPFWIAQLRRPLSDKTIARLKERLMSERPDDLRQAMWDASTLNAESALPLIQRVFRTSGVLEIRQDAGQARVALGDPDIAGEFIELLHRPDHDSVFLGLFGVNDLLRTDRDHRAAALSKAQKAEVIELLLGMVQGAQQKAGLANRSFSIEILTMLAPEELARLAGPLASSSQASERTLGAQILSLSPGKSLPLFLSFAADNDSNVRSSAVDGLAGSNEPVARAALIKLTQDSDQFVRGEAARALGKLRGPEIAPLLERLSRDPERHVRSGALHGWISHDQPAPKELLLERLQDSDAVVRSSAISYICEAKDKQSLSLMLEHFTTGLRRSLDSNTRNLFLIRLRREADPSLADSIRRMLEDSDEMIFAAAVDWLGNFAPKSLVPTLLADAARLSGEKKRRLLEVVRRIETRR